MRVAATKWRSKQEESEREKLEVDAMLELFNRLIERVVSLESAPKDFDTGVPLHRSEIHTVQAIGESDGINVAGLARQLAITKGAVSQMVAKLQGKGLVCKAPDPEDARGVVVRLTPLGWRGYQAHARFHQEMMGAVRSHLGAQLSRRLTLIRSALQDLTGIVEAYAQRTTKR